jgi:aspartate/methionine/tyrosine aminotransferase
MLEIGIAQDSLWPTAPLESGRAPADGPIVTEQAAPRPVISHKAAAFTESVIREMTRLAMDHDAVNLAQGFPDFPAPDEVKRAAIEAIEADVNQYAITWGARGFREAIAAKFERWYGMQVDPERQICVTCGSTEAMIASMLGVIDPGDEVIVFEPFYENYGPDAILAGAVPRYVTLREPDWSFDEAELSSAFTNRTRAIIINSPNNPTGKVFTRTELEAIAGLCQRWGAIALTDEIYEHIVYEGAEHVPIITLPGMEDRTIAVNAMSKTYSVTGWRVGWTIASPALTEGVRKVHDFLTVGAAAPLQEAGVVALNLPRDYYEKTAAEYLERRDFMVETLGSIGLHCTAPLGAYYVMCDIAGLGFADDVAAADHLVREIRVASVPGSSFYSRPELGHRRLRFSFCKRMETLHLAAERLQKLRR